MQSGTKGASSRQKIWTWPKHFSILYLIAAWCEITDLKMCKLQTRTLPILFCWYIFNWIDHPCGLYKVISSYCIVGLASCSNSKDRPAGCTKIRCIFAHSCHEINIDKLQTKAWNFTEQMSQLQPWKCVNVSEAGVSVCSGTYLILEQVQLVCQLQTLLRSHHPRYSQPAPAPSLSEGTMWLLIYYPSFKCLTQHLW